MWAGYYKSSSGQNRVYKGPAATRQKYIQVNSVFEEHIIGVIPFCDGHRRYKPSLVSSMYKQF